MPLQEVLIMAVSKMLSGICVAGFARAPDPVTGLRWVRPVRDFDTLLPGDLTDAAGRLARCGDVVELSLLGPRPDPPHIEDWTIDCVRHRPQLLRRLEGQRRAAFLAGHVDPAPEDVLAHRTRSLCLVRPEQLWARFALDAYSGKYEARMGFTLPGVAVPRPAAGRRGAPVTDLQWLDLGRAWLGKRGGVLTLDHDRLHTWLQADAVYLTLGLSRPYRSVCWPLVVGVHVVPEDVLSVSDQRPGASHPAPQRSQ